MDLVVAVYDITRQFPIDERFGLTSQARRAAVSIPTNIAEGKARFGTGEYRRFVSIASGSVAELETEIDLSERLGFVTASQLTTVRELLDHVGRQVTSLARSLSS
jgi:four helix bundle protein